MSLILLLLLPLLGALVCFLMKEGVARGFAALVAAVQFGFTLKLGASSGWTKISLPWMHDLGIHFALQLDGSNVLLLLLAPLLTTLALVISHRSTAAAELARPSEFGGLMLLMLASLTGLFLADNLGLFYICYEVMLLPAVLLAVRYGGAEGRRAAYKFFLFTLAGSLPMLLGVLSLTFLSPSPNLDFSALGGMSSERQFWLLLLFAGAFAVKIPLVPVHGWLPDLYRSCPPQVTAVIAGAMSKAGIYGFFKVGLLLFPAGLTKILPVLTVLGVLTVLYGAMLALGADSVRATLAYSSLSHMGMMTLGIAALNLPGLSGANLQMFCHGLATGGLFLVLVVLDARGIPDKRSRLGGIAQTAPRLNAVLLLLVMASLGLPGLCSYPGELLILSGLFQRSAFMALLGSLGIILAAWYMLRLYQEAMHGPYGTIREVDDLDVTESFGLAPLVILVVMIGIAPGMWVEPVQGWLEAIQGVVL